MVKDKIRAERFLARKYKAMGLPVQRRTAVEYALFWRRVARFS
ncbi:hypothetical protein 8P_058 [Pseudomonas phage 8P]|nr:hypothetical protein 8P_058 [Pseudomonas phage 8P]